jgi:UDP:flavonoid glycosyltransferase YjiC (YdhE family)
MTDTKYILVGSALFNWSETQRMIEISDELSQRGYRIVFIGSGKYDYLLDTKDFIREHIDYDSSWYTLERISMMLGMDQYGSDFATIEEVENIIVAEINVIKKYNPLAILTGYRMTLTISSKICKIPIVWSLAATLSKIYLESVAEKAEQVNKIKRDLKLPYQEIRALFEDKIACERLLDECKTSTVWNSFLKKNLCSPLVCDLDIYTGDLNLMSDAKELFPELIETETYKFIGPILNNQHIEMPEIVNQVISQNSKRKKVLISIGSGGKKELFVKILQSTLGFDCDFFVSVIGILNNDDIKDYPSNYYFCDKFPLIEIARICDVAIIQGGQGTLYATIAGQCPFASLPATFEQRQNVENLLKHYKCGEIIRMFSVTEQSIKCALTLLLDSAQYKEGIIKVSNDISKYLINRRQSSITAADYIEELIFGKKYL